MTLCHVLGSWGIFVFGMAWAEGAAIRKFLKKSNLACGCAVAFMFFLYYFCENVHCAVCTVRCACE